RRAAELEGFRQALRDRLEYRLARAKRTPEIAADRVLEPDHVLDGQWLIEPVLVAERVERDRVALLAGEDQHRVARRETEQREDDDGDEEGDRDHEQEAAEDVLRHSAAPTSSRAYFCSQPYWKRMIWSGYGSSPLNLLTVRSWATPKRYQMRAGSSTT